MSEYANKKGVDLIRDERMRQLTKWDRDHDDEHDDGFLAVAAAELAVDGTDAILTNLDASDAWGLVAKHRGSRIRQLTIAGALIAAEIDRLQRAAAMRGKEGA